MATQANHDGGTKTVSLEQRFDDLGWAVLLIAVGAIWLLPEEHVPHGSWLIVAGIIMLGLNVARLCNGLRTSGFSVVLGALALIAGLAAFFSINVPLFPIGLIVIGVYILLNSLRAKPTARITGDGWSCCGPRRGGE